MGKIERKKKGFTLVELLAIIVVLAVLAVIAVPVINNIIRTAREKAFMNTEYSVLDAEEYYYARNKLGIGYNNSDVTLLKNEISKISN